MTFRDTLPAPLRHEQWIPVRTVSLTTLLPDGLARSHSIWRCPAKAMTAENVAHTGPVPPGTLPPQTPCPPCGAMVTVACQRCGAALGAVGGFAGTLDCDRLFPCIKATTQHMQDMGIERAI